MFSDCCSYNATVHVSRKKLQLIGHLNYDFQWRWVNTTIRMLCQYTGLLLKKWMPLALFSKLKICVYF